MRNKLTLISAALFAFIVLFTSCEKKCSTCPTLQTCVNGTCECVQGLEGDNCSIHSTDKFQGTYNVYESYNPAYQGQSTQTFTCPIVPSGNQIDKIWFNNFAGTGLQVYGIISTVYVTIPDQDAGASHIAGQGTYNVALRRLDLKYQITTGSDGSVVTSTYQHQ